MCQSVVRDVGRSNVRVSLLVHESPLLVGESAYHISAENGEQINLTIENLVVLPHVNQVKALLKQPWLEHVIDFVKTVSIKLRKSFKSFKSFNSHIPSNLQLGGT